MTGALTSLLALAGLLAQAAAPPAVPATDAERERFLLEADLVRDRAAPGGITGSRRVTLRAGGIEQDAHVQTIDEYKAQHHLRSGMEIDFRDCYRNNLAAYRLDRLLGLHMVPVTVERTYGRRKASFTWWLNEARMTEGERKQRKLAPPDLEDWNRQMLAVRAFDQLIYNIDRNLGNLLIDGGWRVWMIDHTRAFKIFPKLADEKQLPARCARTLLAGLKGLDEGTLQREMDGVLAPGQVTGLLGRRDAIVRHCEDAVRARGEAALYDLPPRLSASPGPR